MNLGKLLADALQLADGAASGRFGGMCREDRLGCQLAGHLLQQRGINRRCLNPLGGARERSAGGCPLLGQGSGAMYLFGHVCQVEIPHKRAD